MVIPIRLIRDACKRLARRLWAVPLSAVTRAGRSVRVGAVPEAVTGRDRGPPPSRAAGL